MLIGIALGDITGIGPEVALKAVARLLPENDARYLLIGPEELAHRLDAELGTGLSPVGFSDPAAASSRVLLFDPLEQPLGNLPSPGDPQASSAALAFLREGAHRCLAGELAALVTAPVNKQAIIEAGHPDFVGQTELLSDLAGTRDTAMMLLGTDDRGRWLRVALVTTHLPLRKVADAITRPAVLKAVRLAADSCRLLGLARAKVAVCGLNPHAGEGGHIGDEELTVIGPALDEARASGLDVVGPLSADTLFHDAIGGRYDAVVAMYHDQGLAPLKLAAFDTGVNWTLGLPFIRTSPDHGTAHDIAGKGVANPSSMMAAIRLAEQLAGGRPTVAKRIGD
jgi:4-hydroxythreonine-4-phosphate dehydrogenase